MVSDTALKARRVRFGGLGLGSGLLGLVLLALMGCILAPIGFGLFMSVWSAPLGEPGQFTIQNYVTAIDSPTARGTIANTIILTVGGAGGATLLGMFLAWVVTSTDVPFRRLLVLLPLATTFLPALLKETTWIDLYSPRSGLINIALERILHIPRPVFNIYSMWGMIVIVALSVSPITYFILLSPFSTMSARLVEASRVAGAGRLQTTFRVLLPLARPAIFSAVALSGMVVAGSFETPILVGLPAGILTYMSTVYQAIHSSAIPNYNLAAAESSVYLLLTLGLFTWYLASTRSERRFAVVMGQGHTSTRMRLGPWRWIVLVVFLAYFWLAFLQLVAGTVLISLLRYYTATIPNPLQNFTLDNYRNLPATPSILQAIGSSLLLAVVVAVLTTAAAVLVTWVSLKTRLRFRRIIEVVGTLSIGFPPMIFSVLLLMSVLFIPIISLAYNTIYAMVVADVVIFLPIAVRIVSGALIQLNDELIEASRVSGATVLRGVRTVILPMLRVALLSSMVLLFTLSFKELGGIVLLTGPNTQLLPTLIFDQWDASSAIGLVAALNLASIAIVAAAVAVGGLATRLEHR